jgi:hypothetical protein
MWSLLTRIIVIITTCSARNATTKVLCLNVYLYSPIACQFWLVCTLFNPFYTELYLQNEYRVSRVQLNTT